MQNSKAVARLEIGARVWRDLGQLAAEAAVIGVLFSLLLAVAVFVVARDNRGDAPRPAVVSTTVDGASPVQIGG